jgi:DNA-directed RNA polymerase subunit RPC12/RpoP
MVLKILYKNHRRLAMELKGYKCNDCSLEFVFGGSEINHCPSCGSSRLEIHKSWYENESLFTMGVSEEDFFINMRKFLVMDEETPDDILKVSTLREYYLAYLPAYIYAVVYEAFWTAVSGFDRQETVWRKVTDWQNTNGKIAGKEVIRCMAANIKGIGEIAKAWKIFNEQTKIDKLSEKVLVEKCIISESDVFNLEGLSKLSAIMENAAKKNVPGNKYRNFKLEKYTYEIDSNRRVFLPVWLGIYRYGGNIYRICCNGEGSIAIYDKPIDIKKKKVLKNIKRLFKWSIGLNIAAVALYCLYAFTPLKQALVLEDRAAEIIQLILIFFTLASAVFLALAGIVGEINRKAMISNSRKAKVEYLPEAERKIAIPRDLSVAAKIIITALVSALEIYLWFKFVFPSL